MKEENLQAVCFLFIISVAVAQDCLQTNNGLPNFMDYGGQQIARLREYHQAIIPSYKFNCCGIITEWGVDVHRGAGNEIEYELNLQVWRPSPTVKEDTGTGSYNLVGSNRFSSISPSDGVAVLPLGSTKSPISFQPGDVLGLYVENTGRDTDGVVMLKSERESVWYAWVGERSTSSVYLVGDNGQLDTSTNAAPVISIATSTSSCSNLPIATALPPPPPNTGSDGTTPPEQSQPTDRVVSHDIPPSNSTDKPIVPTPTISSRDESIEGNGSASDTNNTADLTVGVVVALILIVVLSLTVAIPISVVVLLKVCKARKSTIPTDTNIAYGVTHQELTSTEPLSNATYEYPEVIRPSSMVYNAAYPTNNCSARNPIFWADYQDANEAVSETST